MALIECSECGKQVSNKATSCPNCGAPVSGAVSSQKHVKMTRAGAKWEGLGFLLIVAGIFTSIASEGGLGGTLLLGGFVIL